MSDVCSKSIIHELHLLNLLQEKLEKLKEKEIDYTDIIASKSYFNKLNYISNLIEHLEKIKQNTQNIDQLRPMLHDEELKLEAQNEIEQEEEQLIKNRKLFQELLQKQNEEDFDEVIIEIRGGTGGDEAALFASDLLRMYLRYAEIKKYKTDIIYLSKNELNGIKSCAIQINGPGVYGRFKHESGVHRVQRIPTTESNGRLHTSTASVVILSVPSEIELNIENKHLKIEYYRAGGAGGQHVNKTESAVRLTHLETGIVVQCQDERSQHENRERAMKLLRCKVKEFNAKKQQDQINITRDKMIGTGNRCEKIRTYNFPQNRLTDHVYNLTLYSLNNIIEGDLEEFLNTIIDEYYKSKIIDISDFSKLSILHD